MNKKHRAVTANVATKAPRFHEGVAAILADKLPAQSRAWSELDRSRFVDQFRLPNANEQELGSQAHASSLVSKVKRDRTRSGMSFGFDGGSPNLGPPADAAARSAEVVAYQLSEASTCNGLMPGVECNTIGGDDVSVRLALAFNF